MYTAELKNVYPDQDHPNVSVSEIQFYKDGVEVGGLDFARGLNADSLIGYCRTKIQHLSEQDKIDTYMADPPLGVIETEIVVSPEEQAKREEQQKIFTLTSLKQKVELGLAEQTEYDSVLSGVKLSIEERIK